MNNFFDRYVDRKIKGLSQMNEITIQSEDNPKDQNFTLLLSCPNQKGVVAGVAAFIHQHNGNIYSANQHFDQDAQQFFARFAWHIDNPARDPAEILALLRKQFTDLARQFLMNWQIDLSTRKLRSAIFVSRYDHCLYDLLVHRDELQAQFCCIISNHKDLQPVARHFALPFYHVDFKRLGKPKAEEQQLKILAKFHIELIILARYMQILSPDFLARNYAPAINIHHSFLPAFKGARPYHQAYERGVKIIGATSHYVTAELDQGPIIVQDVRNVSYRDSVADLIRKGRGVEKHVLLQAVQAHCEQRVLRFNNRTIVFPG